MELPEETLQRYRLLEKSLSADCGPFQLFGIFLRENAPNRWDIVASAHWIEASHMNARNLFARRLQKEFPVDDLILLSQIALFPPTGADYETAMRRIERAVRAASGSAELEHSLVEMRDVDLFGQTIDRAYIITAQSLTVPVPA